MTDKKPVSLRVDSALWHEARVQAVKDNIPLNAFVEKALKEKIEGEKK